MCIICQGFIPYKKIIGDIIKVAKKLKTITLTALLSTLMFNSCTNDLTAPANDPVPMGRQEARKNDYGRFFGTDFLLFGAPKKPVHVQGSLSPKVNGYLWQASLDVLSFLPLVSADASGGIIVSEWYIVPNSPHERVKVTVYISDAQLRADALKVAIHKQSKTKSGDWITAATDMATATEMENIILSKARQLRVKSLNS